MKTYDLCILRNNGRTDYTMSYGSCMCWRSFYMQFLFSHKQCFWLHLHIKDSQICNNTFWIFCQILNLWSVSLVQCGFLHALTCTYMHFKLTVANLLTYLNIVLSVFIGSTSFMKYHFLKSNLTTFWSSCYCLCISSFYSLFIHFYLKNSISTECEVSFHVSFKQNLFLLILFSFSSLSSSLNAPW